MKCVKGCLIITMLLGVGYSQDCDPDVYNCDCNEDTWQEYYDSEGMEGCYLYGAILTGANFRWATLGGQTFVGQALSGQTFMGQTYVILLVLQLEMYVRNLFQIVTGMDMMMYHMRLDMKQVLQVVT